AARQHLPWSRGPLTRALAALITWAGIAVGHVPRDVREHLRYRPFRDFCSFNVAAERTAALCFQRLVELVPGSATDLLRIAADEERHRQVFALIAGALAGDDRLAPEMDGARLAAGIGAVGAHFLPRALRSGAVGGHPLGAGGPVWVEEDAGSAPCGREALLARILEATGFPARLHALAAAAGRPLATLRVAIKPSFMLGYHRGDPSPLTDPALVRALVAWLRAQGCGPLVVIEGPTIYDHFFQRRSVPEVAAYFGLAAPEIEVVDAAQEQVTHDYGRGLGQCSVARSWRDAEVRISFGKVRSHPIDQAMLSLGNLEWLGARCDEHLFLERQAQRQTATMMLIDAFPPHLALLDAYAAVPDGVVGMMGTRRAHHPHRLYAGYDAIAVDLVAGRHLGLAQPLRSALMRAASHWFGLPAEAVAVIGVDRPIAGWRGPQADGWSSLLSLVAHPMYMLGSMRGAVFVPQMDVQAFPPRRPPGFGLRLRRRLVQRLLGLDLGLDAPRATAAPADGRS
ncbi:MAG: DUF362 domain-containing protein, partial [Planctomycetes bacterium]|nr:DUF362 domain-containing protein [Planctomycetota bacterium]